MNENKQTSGSNFFAGWQESFQNASEDQIIATTVQSMYEFIQASGMKDGERILQALIMAAKIGIASKTGTLNDKEKKITEKVFGEVLNGGIERLYPLLAEDIREEEYSMMEIFCNLGKDRVGIPLLKYILGFAYIDGEMSDEVAQRLDPIFGIALLADFFHNGPEE